MNSRSIEEHSRAIANALAPRSTTTIPSTQAAGNRLAEDITARVDSPRFRNSQMDGFALSREQAQNTPGEFTVGPIIPAGTDPATVYPHGLTTQVAPVMTGAMVPEGAYAVVPVENCAPASFDTPRTSIPLIDAPQYVRDAGSDISAGQSLLFRGQMITPAGVATLISQGIEEVTVYEKQRILIVTGGAEIGKPGAASIPDSNAPMLAALAQHHGIEVAGFVRTNDDPEQLRHDLHQAPKADAIITSGGISHGKFEVIRQVLAKEGWFGHVAMQPGGPQGLSTFEGTPVISLPGNPVSTLVSFRVFVAPALGQAQPPIYAELTQPTRGLPAKDQLLRGIITKGKAQPIGGTGSHLISQAAPAECLIRIPAGQTANNALIYPL